jgi:hypothetical protein
MSHDDRTDLPEAPLPDPPTARVRSVQWANEPIARIVPPPKPERFWTWRWLLATVVFGLIAFVGAMAVVTGGFRPIEVGPDRPVSPVPVVEATPVPTPSPVAAPAQEPAIAPGPVGQRYAQYTNERYGYSFLYPEDLVIPQGESADGSGQQFVSADGQTVVAIGAAPNTTNAPLEAAFAEAQRHQAGREVTAKAWGGNWYMVSGNEGTMRFYEKTYLTHGLFKTLAVTFPRQYRGTYDPLVDEMIDSFKTLD